MSENNETLQLLIKNKIELLRKKLLDLSLNNPLLSSKLHRPLFIRFVDIHPEMLFQTLQTKEISLIPLPALEKELKDETSKKFKKALEKAREEDPIYLDAIKNKTHPSIDVERQLRDRVRKNLGLGQRVTKSNFNLENHALNHGINPDYDLKISKVKGRDTQEILTLQTLLLPEEFEKRLKSLYEKSRTYKEEVGVNILYLALGFLEWKEHSSSENVCFAPLTLLSVNLEQKLSNKGYAFSISADNTDVEGNIALSEKLRSDFGIIFPPYQYGQSIEEYFQEVILCLNHSKTINWTIKYYATVGIFPSARLAMYRDLDPEDQKILTSPIVQKIFGQVDSLNTTLIFQEEYNSDDPKIEERVPFLITDADSSQFSVIADVLNGEDLVVEGPPGTGKSQTIVNTIAAALGAGKKVLFVAEKTAALEVVKRKLEESGLGNFLLPLQVRKSHKSHIISSIRERLEKKFLEDPVELDEKIKEFRQIRAEMAEYLDLMGRPYGNNNLTLYKVLGKATKLKNLYEKVPEKLKAFIIPLTKLESINEEKKIIEICRSIENIWKDIKHENNLWKEIQAINLDFFETDKIIGTVNQLSRLYLELDKKLGKIKELEASLSLEDIISLGSIFKEISHDFNINEKLDLLEHLSSQKKIDQFVFSLEKYDFLKSEQEQLSLYFPYGIDKQKVIALEHATSILKKHNLSTLNPPSLQEVLCQHEKERERLEEALKFLAQVFSVTHCFKTLKVKNLLIILDKISNTSKQALELRSEKFIDSEVQFEIHKAHKILASLKPFYKEMKEVFVFQPFPEHTEVLHHLKVLSQASWFTIITPEYKKSKNFYLSISYREKFDKKIAARDLKQLATLSHQIKDLQDNHVLQSVISARWEGIETNLAPYLEVIEYVDTVQLFFREDINKSLREFLLSADKQKFLQLPQANDDHPIRLYENMTFVEIYNKLEDVKNKCEEIKKDFLLIQETESLIPVQGSSVLLLSDLPARVKTFLAEKEKLEKSKEVSEILKKYLETEGQRDAYSNIIDLSCILIKLTSNAKIAFFSILKNGLDKEIAPLISSIIELNCTIQEQVRSLSDLTGSSLNSWFQAKSYPEISGHMKLAAQDRTTLRYQSYLNSYIAELHKAGYQHFIDPVVEHYNSFDDLSLLFQVVISNTRARAVYDQYGRLLRKFHGEKLTFLRQKIKELDKEIIGLSRQRLQSKLYKEAYPEWGRSTGKKSELTDMALIKHEIKKTQRFIPIRQLTKRAGKALLELKPCWMMSPLAVAQYIDKGSLNFDLLIMDEASQITPEDAIGSLVRANQVMIVGDTNQLPPTSFFRKMTEGHSEDEDNLITDECILGMASAVFRNSRRLRWHYRSKHESLINFSNKHIYGGNLILFPSPQLPSIKEDTNSLKKNELGVYREYIEGGIYSEGINLIEADRIIIQALAFMRQSPERSLGIVALNQKQRDLLMEKMNLLFEKDDMARAYREKWENQKEGLESFFIKNLENVQGDERDVIFISTVYGPEKAGSPVMQRFGPISGKAGRRRLNVLFTRAKEKIVTFTSLRADDIKAEESNNSGSYMLKLWLEYSATGGNIHSGEITYQEPDSDFERYVIEQIKLMGCEAIPQVGVSGYFIDIGVRHPACPDRFIMGVECDGATYHSSKSARDRDRLRQEVLEKLGWYLYRIWSTDWFNDPLREVEKLKEQIINRVEYYTQNERSLHNDVNSVKPE